MVDASKYKTLKLTSTAGLMHKHEMPQRIHTSTKRGGRRVWQGRGGGKSVHRSWCRFGAAGDASELYNGGWVESTAPAD